MTPKKIPQRMCIGCREMKPKSELIRIVRTPEGEIVLDSGGKVAGRGAYICKSEKCLEKAKKSNALSHIFEKPVDTEIYDELGSKQKAMNDKLLSLLGFAAKSGNLSYGFDSASESAKSGKAKLIIIADDISEKSRKEIIFYADKADVKVLKNAGYSMKTISDAVGKNCGIISVNDSSFADTMVNMGGNADDK